MDFVEREPVGFAGGLVLLPHTAAWVALQQPESLLPGSSSMAGVADVRNDRMLVVAVSLFPPAQLRVERPAPDPSQHDRDRHPALFVVQALLAIFPVPCPCHLLPCSASCSSVYIECLATTRSAGDALHGY
jgi:hypothetical protein